MTIPNGNFKRDLVIFLLTVFTCFLSWMLLDRLQLAGTERQVQIDAQIIDKIPATYVTREEWAKAEKELRDEVFQQHEEILTELRDIRHMLEKQK